MFDKEKALVLNLAEAPKHIREEIESLGGRVHKIEAFEGLSNEAKQWIVKNGAKSRGAMINIMKRSYSDTVADIELAVLGIRMISVVMGEEDANKINLEMYNACAKFVRSYNEENM